MAQPPKLPAQANFGDDEQRACQLAPCAHPIAVRQRRHGARSGGAFNIVWSVFSACASALVIAAVFVSHTDAGAEAKKWVEIAARSADVGAVMSHHLAWLLLGSIIFVSCRSSVGPKPTPNPEHRYSCDRTYCDDHGECFSPSPPNCRQ